MNNEKFKIGTTLRTKILNSFKDKYKDIKVYPVIAPESANQDYVIYKKSDYSIEKTKQGIYQDKCVITFMVVTKDYDRGLDIAIALYHAIKSEGYGEPMVTLQSNNDDYLDDNGVGKYIQMLNFNIE